MLTDAKIRTAKPREKDYKLSDEKGLYLLVKTGGACYWRMKYRHLGRERLLALGVYPEVSLSEARRARDDARSLLRSGQDPGTAKREAKHASKLRLERSFEAIARRWIDKESSRWTEAHSARVLRSLELDIFPVLGQVPLDDINAAKVLDVLRAVEARGSHETAHRLAQRCWAVFRFAIGSGIAERNPCSDIRGVLKTSKPVHRAAVNMSELPALLASIRDYHGRDLTRLALMMLAHTFVRPGELRGAHWAEFDLSAARWEIPGERMKMRAPHVVPLSHQVLGILEQIKSLTGRFELVFPSERNPRESMSENTLTYALYRLGYHSRQTAHGFRAIASTYLNQAGFRPDVIERQLAHIEKNKVRAAYHRAEYLAERTAMMQAYSDYLDSLTDGAKVVPIRRHV